MAFLEDPRMRQRWNRLSHNAGEVTENAAAGIWTFQHNYINPCFASIAASLESCTAPCLGEREERARRQRERERLQGRAEYSFDFYDDWAADELEGGGILGGGWGGEDWDRLLAGTSSQRKHNGGDGAGIQQEQPRRKRGMSYGTRGGRRKKGGEQDPTIIPSTQPIGFLSRLPWKMGKTLRYKPSAADLQDHPKQHDAPGRRGFGGENEPLLPHDENDDDDFYSDDEAAGFPTSRKRSGTTGSGDTSDSYRSRGDLFPSDGEGEEDAVPLDDEFTMVLDKMGGGGMDDKSSSRTRSSKGKRPASGRMSRTVSRATIDTQLSRRSSTMGMRHSSAGSVPPTPAEVLSMPSMEDLRREEERVQQEEEAEVERKRRAATALAIERGLRAAKSQEAAAEAPETPSEDLVASDKPDLKESSREETAETVDAPKEVPAVATESFVPARLPFFG
jgi:hypothetical protein